jgi:hypothetical protein
MTPTKKANLPQSTQRTQRKDRDFQDKTPAFLIFLNYRCDLCGLCGENGLFSGESLHYDKSVHAVPSNG